MPIMVKRVYEPPDPGDGKRVLVDRFWPRGVRKDEAGLDAWLKDLAPSRDLISWFGHRPERWDEFKRRYWSELARPEAQLSLRHLRDLMASSLTLIYSARDDEHNNAVALREYLGGEATGDAPV